MSYPARKTCPFFQTRLDISGSADTIKGERNAMNRTTLFCKPFSENCRWVRDSVWRKKRSPASSPREHCAVSAPLAFRQRAKGHSPNPIVRGAGKAECGTASKAGRIPTVIRERILFSHMAAAPTADCPDQTGRNGKDFPYPA